MPRWTGCAVNYCARNAARPRPIVAAARCADMAAVRSRFFFALVLSAALACAADGTKVAATKVGPPQGRLLVVGGGAMGPLWGTFIELAGGKDGEFVVIPTAGETIADVDKAVETLK